MGVRRQKVRSGILLTIFVLFPAIYYYFSPYLIIMGASEGIVSGSFVVFVSLFLVSLFLGRAFCSWGCALGGMQDYCFSSNDKRVSNRLNWIRYLIFVPWAGIIIYMAVTAGGFKKVDFTYQTVWGISVSSVQSLVMYFIVVVITLILAFTTGRRALCHYVCWMSPFMIAGRKLRNAFKWPSLRLKAESIACKKCKVCISVCPMSIDVMAMVENGKMENSECILCGRCVDNCKNAAISYSFSRGVQSSF